MKYDYLLIDEILTETWQALCSIINQHNINYNCYTVNSNIYLKLYYKPTKELSALLHSFYYYNDIECITKKSFNDNVCDYDNADYLIVN